jgi:hypothetical protein
MFKKYVEFLKVNHPEMNCMVQPPYMSICLVPGKACEDIHNNYQPITIRFNDSLGFKIPPKSYLKTDQIPGGQKNCYNMVLFSPLASSVILGDVFMENYYVIYDFENTLIGFNGYVQEGLPVEPPKPAPFSKGSTLIIIVVAVSVVIFVAVGVGAYLIKRRNKRL